jgi:tetratricopeptide (TPR) repeat protein
MFAGSEEVSRTIPEVTARAIPILEKAGDDIGLARAWRLRGEMAGLAAHWGARAEALERAVEHARLAGNLREEATLVALLAFSFYYGPTPVPEAIARCERFLEEVTGDRSLEAAIENTLAGLRAMQGEFEEARRLWLQASSQYQELGLNFRRAARALIAARIEMLADDYEAAERELRWAYETLEKMGDKGVRAPVAAYLGEVLYERGRHEEAERFAELARELAAADDVVPQAIWRSVRAKVLATRGELEEAETLGRQAAALVESTDFPDLQATTFLSLAEVLETAGKAKEAREFVDSAHALYEQKGNLVAAGRIVREANTKGRRR